MGSCCLLPLYLALRRNFISITFIFLFYFKNISCIYLTKREMARERKQAGGMRPIFTSFSDFYLLPPQRGVNRLSAYQTGRLNFPRLR